MEKREGYKKTAIGWIPEDWDIKRVDEIADVLLSNVDKKSTPNEIDILLCNYMDVFHNDYITSSMDFMEATATPHEIEKFSLIKNDVLLTKDSETQEDIAQPAVVSENLEGVLCGYHLAILRPKEDQIAGRFLMNTINSPAVHNYFVKLTNGVTRFGLNKLSINGAIVPLPPLPEQNKIASILTTVDDKISSIDSQIQQTEQLKKGLMEKLLTEGIGHTEFKETEIGRIPVGWDVSTLAEAKINIIDGDRGTNYPKQDDFYEDGFCLFLTAKNVSKIGFRFDETQYISEERDGLLRKGKLVRNDIVITTRGTVGNIAWYNTDVKLENIRINSGMALIRKSIENVDSLFLYLLFRSHLVQKQIKLIAFGSAQPQLTIKEIKKFRIILPPIEEQNQIATILSTVDNKLDILTQKKSQYQTLKKGLSQQLLTGQMRVKV
jgi:type I restriction enzyme, S subunit